MSDDFSPAVVKDYLDRGGDPARLSKRAKGLLAQDFIAKGGDPSRLRPELRPVPGGAPAPASAPAPAPAPKDKPWWFFGPTPSESPVSVNPPPSGMDRIGTESATNPFQTAMEEIGKRGSESVVGGLQRGLDKAMQGREMLIEGTIGMDPKLAGRGALKGMAGGLGAAVQAIPQVAAMTGAGSAFQSAMADETKAKREIPLGAKILNLPNKGWEEFDKATGGTVAKLTGSEDAGQIASLLAAALALKGLSKGESLVRGKLPPNFVGSTKPGLVAARETLPLVPERGMAGKPATPAIPPAPPEALSDVRLAKGSPFGRRKQALVESGAITPGEAAVVPKPEAARMPFGERRQALVDAGVITSREGGAKAAVVPEKGAAPPERPVTPEKPAAPADIPGTVRQAIIDSKGVEVRRLESAITAARGRESFEMESNPALIEARKRQAEGLRVVGKAKALAEKSGWDFAEIENRVRTEARLDEGFANAEQARQLAETPPPAPATDAPPAPATGKGEPPEKGKAAPFREAKPEAPPAETKGSGVVSDPGTTPFGTAAEKGEIVGSRHEPLGPVARRSQIMALIEKAAGVPLRIGRFRQRARGVFKVRPEVTRVKGALDTPVAAHEAGHALDKGVFKAAIDAAPEGVRADLVRMGKELYGDRKPSKALRKDGHLSEGFAEMLKDYVHERGMAKPETLSWFDEILTAAPERVRKYLDQARALAREYEQQGPLGRFDAQMRDPPGILERMKRAIHDPTKPKAQRTYAPRPLHDLSPRNVERTLIDDMFPFRRMEEALYGEAKPGGLYDTASALNRSVAARAHAGVDSGTFGSSLGKGLAEILEPVSAKGAKRIKETLRYVNARRALDYVELAKRRGISFEEATGLRRADVDFVLDRYGKEPDIVAAAEGLTAWNQRLLHHVMVEKGGMPEADFLRYTKENPNYIHWERVFDDIPGSKGGGGTGSWLDFQGPVKGRTGSVREFRNVLDTAVADAERMLSIGDKLEMHKLLKEAADKEGAGRFIEEVPRDQVPHSYTLEGVQKRLQEMGLDVIDAKDIGSLGKASESMVTFYEAATRAPNGEYIFSLMKDGKRKWFQLDPEIARAMDNMAPHERGIFQKGLNVLARTVRLGATGFNAGFLIANPMRDIFSYLLFADARAGRSVKNLAASLRNTVGDTTARRLYRGQGVEASSFAGMDRRFIARKVERILATTKGQRAWNVVKNAPDAFRELSGNIETWPRMAEFLNQLENAGWTRERLRSGEIPPREVLLRAANAASDVTVNFRRAGEYSRVMNDVTAFFNPNVQALDKLARESGVFGRTVVGGKPRAARMKRFLGRGIAYITVPALLNWWANKDKDWWNRAPDWEKNAFHLVDGLGLLDEPLRIPKPHALGAFANIPVALAEEAYAKDPEGMTKTMNDLAEFVGTTPPSDEVHRGQEGALGGAAREIGKQLLPPLMPTGMEIYGDVREKRDTFTGRSIIPRRLEGVETSEQYSERTTETAKALGKILGIAPIMVDYILYRSTGGLASSAVEVAEAGARKVGIFGKRKSSGGKAPIVGRFMTTGMESRDYERFYELRDEITKNSATARLGKREADRGLDTWRIPPRLITRMERLRKATEDARSRFFDAEDAKEKTVAKDEFHRLAAQSLRFAEMLKGEIDKRRERVQR